MQVPSRSHQPGSVRFAQWLTGMVLCWKEHTITQIVIVLRLESRCRVPEHFAGYGVWDRILGVFDGVYALETVVQACLEPPDGRRRIDLVTRLRVDARLYHFRYKHLRSRWAVSGPHLPVHVFIIMGIRKSCLSFCAKSFIIELGLNKSYCT